MKKSRFISLLIGIVSAVAAFVFLFPGLQDSLDKATVNMSSSIQTVVGILPIIYATIIVLGLTAWIASDGPEKVKSYLNWRAFGNRMKEAYASKFGGKNPAFNQEVDMHIKAVRTLSKGRNNYTKDLNIDWLKSRAQFVEIEFVIPEEDYLSEEEKTRQFEDVK